MKKETEALNKILVKHKIPITKTPVVAYGRKAKRIYYNTFTKARGENLEEVVGKEIYDKNDYTIINRKGYYASRYICYEIPKSDIICFAELIIHFSEIEKKDNAWTLYNVVLFNKKKESLSTITFTSKNYCGNIPVVYDSETTAKECRKYIREFAKNEPFIRDKLGKIYYTCVDTYGYWRYNSYNTFCVSMQNALKASEDEKIGINGETYAEMTNIISKFFGGKIKNIGGSKVVDITTSPKNLNKYLMYKEPKGMTTENIKKDKFLNIKLKDIKYNPSYNSCVGFIERINDNMCVLRTMKKNDEEKTMDEICKIFIDKKKAYAYKKNDFNNWCKMRLSISVDTLNFKLTGFESKNTDGTMLEYFGKIIEDIPENKRDVILKLLITDPFLEQLLKSEFKEFVLYCLLNSYENFNYNAWMTKYFGKIDKTQKGFYKKLGLNKYQIEWFAKLYTKNKEKAVDEKYRKFGPPFLSISCFSQIFNTNLNFEPCYYRNEIEYIDISFLDNKSFEILANAFKNGTKDRYIRNNIFLEKNFPHIIYKLYGLSTLVNMIDYIKYFNKVAKKNWHATSYYRDYLCMVNEMCTFEDFDKSAYKPYFDKNKVIGSITSMHDMLVELYNVKRDEISIKAFKEATKKLSKWTYEDGDFAVIAPQKPDDLAIEGTTLHHCVKSYIGRVTEGYTNIMFIRKISDKSKPFFTVEVSNSGAIEQVHGSCNCNVEKESDLEKFVTNWAKNKKLKLTNFNKIR